MEINKKLLYLRKSQGLKCEQLSDFLGISTDLINDWESGKSIPDINMTLNICKYFKIKIDIFTDDKRFVRWIKKHLKTHKNKFIFKTITISFFCLLLLIFIILSAFLINNLYSNKSNDLNINKLNNFQLKDGTGLTIEELSKSVFLLEVYSAKDELIATGSGFLAINNTTLITNYHVIVDGYKVLAIGYDDISYTVKGVKGYDTELDIAILELDTVISATVLDFGNTDLLELGEEVTAIGSPLGLKNTVSKGVVSAQREIDGKNYIQTTAQISSGSSGGALFNSNGEVIGITSESYIYGQNLNLAIPIEYINKVTVGEKITELSTVVNDNKVFSSIISNLNDYNSCAEYNNIIYYEEEGYELADCAVTYDFKNNIWDTLYLRGTCFNIFRNNLYYINGKNICYLDLNNKIKHENIYTSRYNIKNMSVGKYGFVLEQYTDDKNYSFIALDWDYNVIYENEEKLLSFSENGFLYTQNIQNVSDVVCYYDIKSGDIAIHKIPLNEIYELPSLKKFFLEHSGFYTYKNYLLFGLKKIIVYNLTTDEYFITNMPKTDLGFGMKTIHDNNIYYTLCNSYDEETYIRTYSSTYKMNIDGTQNKIFFNEPLRGIKITSNGYFIATIYGENTVVYLDENGNEISRYNY